jgi:DnaJ-class molecular chaperone
VPETIKWKILYAILGVAPNASDDDIKKVYRSLAMRYHPDRNQAPGAEARFKAVTKAYEVLSDAARRSEYDQSVNHRIVLDAEARSVRIVALPVRPERRDAATLIQQALTRLKI